MFIISTIYKTFIDALFPLSGAERELFLLLPEQAYEKLPPMRGYQGLAVPLLNTDSIFAYKDERVAKLVWNIKYKKSSHAVRVGGYALWKTLRAGEDEKVPRDARRALVSARYSPSPSLSPKCPSKSFSSSPATVPTLIIPMPITNRRRKERGYNQCELLVDEIEKLENSIQPQFSGTIHLQNFKNYGFIFEKNLLIRTHHLDRQTLKGRKDRVESSQGIFGVNEEVVERLKIQLLKDSENISEKIETDGIKNLVDIKKIPVIIIDDVITTGSTMYSAIETLKKVGFENVRGLSLAH